MTITVSNPADAPAGQRIIEVDAIAITEDLGTTLSITDDNGSRLPYQITSDSLLLFPADIKPGAKAEFTITSADSPTTCDTIAFAQLRPDKQDDLAWENDHGGYRLYGPVYHRGNGPARGYDVWTKSVPHRVLAQRYENDHNGISYHIDHGDGMDPYSVGPTLGAGLAALVDSTGNIVMPKGYNKAEITDNGPLRIKVKLDIDPVVVDGDTVTETRVITLDRGSWLNKTTVSYSGLTHPVTLASGIVIHAQNPDAYRIDNINKSVTYDDLTDNADAGNGVVYIGLVDPAADSLLYCPIPNPAGDALGHVMAMHTYKPEDPALTYYWGAAWSKGGVENSAHWDRLVSSETAAFKASATVKTTKTGVAVEDIFKFTCSSPWRWGGGSLLVLIIMGLVIKKRINITRMKIENNIDNE